MQQTRINPQIHQELLESAPNAAAKGQAQYYTPGDWASVLGLPLPRSRRTVVDLTAGNGQLLAGIGNGHSKLLGCDIDPVAVSRESTADKYRVTADLTKFQSLLHEVKFEADLFALNPPWDLHWHRDRLARLADSPCRAVAAAFAAHDGRCANTTIDSTIATLCLALDFCSAFGEGVLIANESTLQRLIFAADAPHRALVNHIWAHLVVDGNICQPVTVAASRESAADSFKTGVLYFARAPQSGTPYHQTAFDLNEARDACGAINRQRLRLRRGAEASKDYNFTEETPELWQAAKEEWERKFARSAGGRGANHWNIMLSPAGTIQTDLSLFDKHSDRIEKGEVARLFALNGRSPMSLVIQKSHRKELERAAFGDIWRVELALQQAVRMAIKEYNAVRAPIRALNEIQRLGYLDEEDDIVCRKDLWAGGTPSLAGAGEGRGEGRGENPFNPAHPIFVTGQRYALRTLTISVRREGEKMNLSGELDAVEWTGSELCIYIKDATGTERCFMEGRLRNDKVHLSLPDLDPEEAEKEDNRIKIDFTLQQLVDHFTIPDVPPVATVHPELFQRYVAMLHEIEQLVA